jgi:hypothetical protein
VGSLFLLKKKFQPQNKEKRIFLWQFEDLLLPLPTNQKPEQYEEIYFTPDYHDDDVRLWQ